MSEIFERILREEHMTKDDIIRMAREAGITFVNEFGVASATPEWLERFAKLVAASERDRIADESKHIIKRAEARGATAERERLAEPEQEQEPFEYWNAVDGWVTVTLNEVLDGRARQRMIQAAIKAVQEQYRGDPEVMFAKGWDAGFAARTCGPNRKEQGGANDV